MKHTERLAVLGAGTMGHSIALAGMMSGYEVIVWGNHEEDIRRGQQGIADKLDVLLQYEAIDESDKDAIASRVQFTLSVEACVAERTFIIEAIPEVLELKQNMFNKLETIVPQDTVIASNTSGLSPTAIATGMKSPSRAIVTHFWNPGHLIPLVEVVPGEETSEETIERSRQLLISMNKKPIVIRKDVLGSIGNRIQYAMFREAQYLLELGVATVEEIDDAVRYSLGRRLAVTGPFMTADMGGLDVFDAISSYLFPDLSSHQASLPQMRSHVDAGQWGQKSGAGFYSWSEERLKMLNEERERELITWMKRDLQQARQQHGEEDRHDIEWLGGKT